MPPRRLLLILAEGGDEFAVLRLGSDGYAEAVLAELHSVAVAHDDAAVHQIVVTVWSPTEELNCALIWPFSNVWTQFNWKFATLKSRQKSNICDFTTFTTFLMILLVISFEKCNFATENVIEKCKFELIS